MNKRNYNKAFGGNQGPRKLIRGSQYVPYSQWTGEQKWAAAVARTAALRKLRNNYGKYTQSHPGGEIKGYDITNSATPTLNSAASWTFSSTALINSLSLCTIGTSSWNRIGRKLSLKSFRIRGAMIPTGNNFSVTTPQYCRAVLLYDKQPNGALPLSTDVFLSQASVAADTTFASVFSGVNLNNRDRFEILLDRQWCMAPSNTSTGTAPLAGMTSMPNDDHMTIDWFVKLRNRETHYKSDGSPAVIGDLSTGNLVFITFGNLTTGQEPYQLNASIRIRYSDL